MCFCSNERQAPQCQHEKQGDEVDRSPLLILALFGRFGVQTEMLVASLQALLRSSLNTEAPQIALTIACGAGHAVLRDEKIALISLVRTRLA